MSQLLPQLAVDVVLNKLRYPLMGFQKIDGVRGCHITGQMTGRSLKPHGNKAITARYSGADYIGFDGEFTLDGRLTGDELCNLTNSVMTTHEGDINVVWNLFEYLHPDLLGLPYIERWTLLDQYVRSTLLPGVRVLPWVWIKDEAAAQAWIDKCLDEEYEGAIFRDPTALHKSGRATATKNDFWRYKPTSDKDALVIRIEEGQTNLNEAKVDPRGRTERSTHTANMVPNGMVGTLISLDCETNQEIRVSPGKMKHDERIACLKNPSLIVYHYIKYRSLDTGVKDAPRQARFICRRAKADMS